MPLTSWKEMKMSHKAGGGLLGLLLLGGIAFAAFTRHDDNYAEPALGPTTAEGGSLGCVSLKDTLRFQEFIGQNDMKAMDDYVRPRLKMGICGVISAGDQIIVEGKARHPDALIDKKFHGLICARKLGQTECIWQLASYVFPALENKSAN